MLAHERTIDIFNEILGPGYRLDHGPGLIRMVKGTEGHRLHGGMTFDPSQYHRFDHGRVQCGLCVAAWQLTEVRPGDGGFACIPGSHKANFPIPEDMTTFESGLYDGVDKSLVRWVPCKAGSAVIFTEALCHGASRWTSDRERVTLFYKYNHAGMKFHSFFPTREALEKMTLSQRSFYIEVSSDARDARQLYPGR